MSRISRIAKAIAFILLTGIALYSAYFTAHIKTANEHVLFSRGAVRVPLSGAVGEKVICAYGRFWKVKCSTDEHLAEVTERLAAFPEILAEINQPIRYLCPIHMETQHFDCIDRNMVGVATMLTLLAAAIAAAALARDAWRLPDRRSAGFAILRYVVCAGASLLLLWQLSRVILPTIWMDTLQEQMIATKPILAFTGNVIGYGLLIALAAIGLVGAVASAIAMAKR